MSKLLFFSRVALICNACFLVTFALHYMPFVHKELVPETIEITGNVLAIVLSLILNISVVILLLAGKPVRSAVPAWLLLTNFIFFIFQVILLIK
jgi:hypothetical protein